MTSASKSLFVFAVYVLLLGVAFILAPATVMNVLGLPALSTGWARLIGVLALVIGTYDVVGARTESLVYITASVYVRLGFAGAVTLLVLSHEMPVAALPIGAIDFAGAVWTAVALRRGGR